MPENLLPLKLSGFRLLKWQQSQDDIKKWELVPDFPAIWAALRIYTDPAAATVCDQLLDVLSHTVKPKKHASH